MIKARHLLIAFLFSPILLLQLIVVESEAFLSKIGFLETISRLKLKMIYARMSFRLIRKGYSNQEVGDIIDRWRNREIVKIKRELNESDKKLTEAIANMSHHLGVPEYEIRSYVEDKMSND